ncbi:MAG: hypothetical protein ACR2O0_13490 [Rhizobiaceae bacterium]
MEQLEQLRHMRDEARKRISATADYKLATSLDALIADLEEVLGASSSEEGESAEGKDDADADAEIAPEAVVAVSTEEAATEEAPAEAVVEEVEETVDETVEEAKSEEDDVSDLSRALAEQLEQETATMSQSARTDEESLAPPAPANGSSSSHDESEDDSEEDALIRAMRELDEDLANADLADEAKTAK